MILILGIYYYRIIKFWVIMMALQLLKTLILHTLIPMNKMLRHWLCFKITHVGNKLDGSCLYHSFLLIPTSRVQPFSLISHLFSLWPFLQLYIFVYKIRAHPTLSSRAMSGSPRRSSPTLVLEAGPRHPARGTAALGGDPWVPARWEHSPLRLSRWSPAWYRKDTEMTHPQRSRKWRRGDVSGSDIKSEIAPKLPVPKIRQWSQDEVLSEV